VRCPVTTQHGEQCLHEVEDEGEDRCRFHVWMRDRPAKANQTFVDLMLAQTCWYCGALPGDVCRTVSGQRTGSHASRFYEAKRVIAERTPNLPP